MKKFIIFAISLLLVLNIFLIWVVINGYEEELLKGVATIAGKKHGAASTGESVETGVLTAADSIEEAPGRDAAETDEQTAPVTADDFVDTEAVADADSLVDGASEDAIANDEEPGVSIVDPTVVELSEALAVDSTDVTGLAASADATENAATGTVTDGKQLDLAEDGDSAGDSVPDSADSFSDALQEIVTAATKSGEADVVPGGDVGREARSAADSYVDVLSSEVGGTNMEANEATASTDEAPEPAVVLDASADTSEMANKVIGELEKILTGTTSGEVKQEDLAGIVSTAVREGGEIDAIERAVNEAMLELRRKEGLDIQPEVLEFAEKSIHEIVAASKDIALGDPSDPYIQSLNAEVDGTSLKRSTVAGITVAEQGTQTGNAESEPGEAAEARAPRVRTIVVLKGDTLYAIAAKIYGSGRKYPHLYKANRDLLNNPDLIEVGQVLRVPPLTTE